MWLLPTCASTLWNSSARGTDGDVRGERRVSEAEEALVRGVVDGAVGDGEVAGAGR